MNVKNIEKDTNFINEKSKIISTLVKHGAMDPLAHVFTQRVGKVRPASIILPAEYLKQRSLNNVKL